MFSSKGCLEQRHPEWVSRQERAWWYGWYTWETDSGLTSHYNKDSLVCSLCNDHLHPLVSDIPLTLPPNHAPSDVYPIVALQIPHYSTSRTELGTRPTSDVTEHEHNL